MAEDNEPVLAQPAYKTVSLTFGDAAITLRGDGSLDGDLEAFTRAMTQVHPGADNVAFAIGWLVARSELWVKAVNKMEEIAKSLDHTDHHHPGVDPVEWQSAQNVVTDPDPGDADPVEMFPEGKAMHAKMNSRGDLRSWADMAPEDQAAWQSMAENERRLSERTMHEEKQRQYEASRARVVQDYNA